MKVFGVVQKHNHRGIVNVCLRVCVCELSKSFTSTSPHRPFASFVQVFVRTVSFPSPSMDSLAPDTVF